MSDTDRDAAEKGRAAVRKDRTAVLREWMQEGWSKAKTEVWISLLPSHRPDQL